MKAHSTTPSRLGKHHKPQGGFGFTIPCGNDQIINLTIRGRGSRNNQPQHLDKSLPHTHTQMEDKILREVEDAII